MLFAVAPSVHRSISDALDSVKLAGATISVSVERPSGEVLFERRSGDHVMPASNQKLFSAAFALYELGAQWRPLTRLWKYANRTFVDTTGDPMLSYDQLMQAAKNADLDHRLPVQVREPYSPGYPVGWELDDLPNRYAAPVSAFCVDQASFEIWQRAGRAYAKPNAYHTSIYPTGGDGKPVVTYDPFSGRIEVSGKLGDSDSRLDTLAVAHPDREAALLLGSSFQRVDDPVPSDSPTVSIQGKELTDIMSYCLKRSDNNIAENLLLMAAAHEGPLGSDPYAVACQRLADFLERVVGIDPSDLHSVDGSGLSRHDFVTTRAITKLLAWESRQPTAETWQKCLAKSGESGTLAKRMTNISFQGKTGTSDMVCALSGYVGNISGEQVICSIVINQFGCSVKDTESLMDEFMSSVQSTDFGKSSLLSVSRSSSRSAFWTWLRPPSFTQAAKSSS